MSRRELEGVRVVEYGPFINAAYAGRFLADLGAQVIKVESPAGDDPARIHGPFPGDIPDVEKSGYHLYANANKFGVTLDPDSATGRRLFSQLAAWADVLIDGTQPGHLAALGIDYADLEKDNPRLVMVGISSLGRSGPYACYKGYDLTSWHGSGTSHIYQGEPDREPLWGVWNHASYWGGGNAAAAVMLALHAREVTGRGQYVDVSEAEALAALFLAVEVSDFNQSGACKVRAGIKGLENHAPSTMRQTKEGWVFIMALASHQWDGLVQAMGNPDWATTTLFKGTSRERAPYADEIYALMSDWLESHTAQELFHLCQSHGVPAAPLNTVKDLYEDPHLEARGFFVQQDHPRAGRLRMAGAPFLISGGPWRLDRPAPLLGQHNVEVYCAWLGLPRAQLPDLRRAGVI
ncbi:MAG: CoA transferase [Dehalococcoidia bacterium]